MSKAPVRLKNHIGGESLDPVEGERFLVPDPTTGETASEVPDSGLMDVVKAIQGAHKAWPAWQRTESPARAELLEKIAALIESDLERLALKQAREEGLILREARESVGRAAKVLRYYSRELALTTETVTGESGSSFTRHLMPIGVATVITPASDSFFLLASRVGAALAAGNVVIAKPSEHAPQTADSFAEITSRAGLPAGVFNLVQGRGAAGEALIQHPGTHTISFNGSTEVGRQIQVAAAESLKRVHLSMGARNPVLVFGTVDIERAAKRVAELATSGPMCLRGSRLFVQESIYKPFLEAFKNQMESLKVGDPTDEATQVGPLPGAKYLESFSKAVMQATGENGKLLQGGAETKGFFAKPTTVMDLTLCSTLQQEEVPGPFVTAYSFKYQHDAVKHANNCPFAQAAYVFEADAEKAQKIALKIEASRVYANAWEGRPWEPSLTWQGMKQSGQGADGGLEILRHFSRTPTVIV